MPDSRREALDMLMRDYADIGARSRTGLIITPGESKDSYGVSAIGVIRAKRILILTAPVTEDGALVAVMNGQVLVCRWFGSTAAFRFRVKIVRMVFEPLPLLHVELPPIVERRTVRGVPRALSTLRAALKMPADVDVAIVDISISGARIALSSDVSLPNGKEIALLARPKLMNRQFTLTLHGHVVANFGYADPTHPEIQFFGIEFREMSDHTLLTLHAYVQECLAFETDTLAQILMLASREVDTID